MRPPVGKDTSVGNDPFPVSDLDASLIVKSLIVSWMTHSTRQTRTRVNQTPVDPTRHAYRSLSFASKLPVLSTLVSVSRFKSLVNKLFFTIIIEEIIPFSLSKLCLGARQFGGVSCTIRVFLSSRLSQTFISSASNPV